MEKSQEFLLNHLKKYYQDTMINIEEYLIYKARLIMFDVDVAFLFHSGQKGHYFYNS